MDEKKPSFHLDVVSVRLVHDAPICSEKPIHTPEDAVKLIGKYLCEMDREVFCIINLKTSGIPINCHFVSMGAIDHTVTHPREMFKASILSNAASMICVHNHPSGNIQPSEVDTKVTERMIYVCDMMGIPLFDHIIVGGDNSNFFSFRRKGIMPHSSISFQTDYEELTFPPVQAAERGR